MPTDLRGHRSRHAGGRPILSGKVWMGNKNMEQNTTKIAKNIILTQEIDGHTQMV